MPQALLHGMCGNVVRHDMEDNQGRAKMFGKTGGVVESDGRVGGKIYRHKDGRAQRLCPGGGFCFCELLLTHLRDEGLIELAKIHGWRRSFVTSLLRAKQDASKLG